MRFKLKDIQNSTARIAAVADKRPIPSTDVELRPKAGRQAVLALTPHDILWAAVRERWGTQAIREFKDAVPNRRYRIDIAFPGSRVAIEVF